jgi:hypothetical protein
VLPVRQAAQRAAISLDQYSRQRSGILDSLATPEMIEAFHRHLSAGVIYDDEVDDDDGQPRDLFDGKIAAGTTPLTPRRGAPKPPKPSKPSKAAPDPTPAAKLRPKKSAAKKAASKKPSPVKARAKPPRASSKHRQPKRRAEPSVNARARAKSNQAPSNQSRRTKPTRAWTIKEPKR